MYNEGKKKIRLKNYDKIKQLEENDIIMHGGQGRQYENF